MREPDRPESVILVRYGEIALKGQNRGEFERRLVRNMQNVLPDGARVRRGSGRMYVTGPGDLEDMLSRLRRVFGIVSLSPALHVPVDDEEIAEAALQVAKTAVQEQDGHLTFKIEARRADKSYHRTSPEINQWLGAQVLRRISDISVDLHEPDLRLKAEIRPDGAYLMGRVVPGPGGLPVGSSGKGMVLLSGGIDSPVAAWYMMKRGLKMEAVHFHTPPFTSPRAQKKVEDLVSILAPHNDGMKLHLFHFTHLQEEIQRHCPERLGLSIMRRTMLRTAQQLALQRDISALVTGESLGQVASQTLENLTASNAAVDLPVLRPLVGLDKEEVIGRARAIGTYDVSVRPHEDCCTLFVPDHPKTRPSLEEVLRAEKQAELDAGEDPGKLVTSVEYDALGELRDAGANMQP